METLKIPIQAGETKTFGIAGQYIEVLEAGGVMDIILYGPTGAVESAREAEQGSWMREAFTSFTIKSSITQTIKLVITSREGGTRRQSGAVSITNVNGAFSQAQANVTNAAGGVQLAAANDDRRYLLIQNRDPVNDVFVTLNGSVPTNAGGVKVEAGGALELQGFLPTAAVRAVAVAASVPVIVVEG